MELVQSRAQVLEPPASTTTAEDEEHMRRINQLAQTELERDQVYIRSMYLCSSQLCETDWCRFTDTALEQIAEKVVGESVLAGHDKQSLPVARFFKATVVERPDVPDPESGAPTHWVRAWFYWLKETRGAKDLALNMDGGIYREVSISWRYRAGHCSICGQPSRSCPHHAGQTYEEGRCFTWISEIVDVLEGSLVYRGADRRTGIAGEHGAADETAAITPLERLLQFEFAPFPSMGG